MSENRGADTITRSAKTVHFAAACLIAVGCSDALVEDEAASEQAVGESGLVAAYSFDEGSGGTTADASGNSNAGRLEGATWSSQGKFGGSLSFNGTNSRVTVPDATSLDLSTAMTLEAWVYPTKLSGSWRTVILKEQPGDLVVVVDTSASADESLRQQKTAAAEAVLGLGLIVAVSRKHAELDVDKLTALKG